MPTTPPTEGTVPPVEPLPHLRVSAEDRRLRGPDSDADDPAPEEERHLSLRARRELIVFGIALLVGLVLMPFLIWYAGNRVLGPYAHPQTPHPGPFSLLQDYYIGLLHGSAVFWAVALGPALLILLLRLIVWVVRAIPPRQRA